MILQKIYYHLVSRFCKMFYVIIYRKKLVICKGTTFRACFKIIIANGGEVSIGNNCFFNHYCSISARKSITVGDNTIMGENVKIMDHNHKFRSFDIPIKEQGYSEGEVSIGNNCWIGSNVVILKGAHIGDHCVIGAGCVIDFCVPPNTIVKTSSEYSFIHIEG